MTWSQQAALARIEQHRKSVPETAITVEDYTAFVDTRLRSIELAKSLGQTSEPIWRIGRNRAVTTHGVHVYANLVDFNDTLLDSGKETEASHERAMQFLHLHYGACDALIAAFDIQRVDFHGGRLHAVVLSPAGAAGEATRIEKALAFSAALIQMVARASERYGSEFRTGVRIGIDSGPAVAINSGSRGEPDPLFIGSPANHAAHLACGDEPGVFVSARAERARSLGAAFASEPVRMRDDVVTAALDRSVEVRGTFLGGRNRLEEAFSRFVDDRDALKAASGGLRPASFVFHYRQPPLRTIDFADHPPSRSIRMPVVSVFADLAGYTAYVDQAIQTGKVAEAVANLYIIRSELTDVLQKDFDGRKVRYIGDCLHGLIAEGDARSTDEKRSVKAAVLAASGIRSSFNLCRQILPGLAGLEGIAIGLELGWTPLCRIGLTGEASVRCSTSKATCLSESLQGDCNGRQTALGDRAFREADAKVRYLFGPLQRVDNLDHVTAVAQLDGVSSAAVIKSQDHMEAHCRP